MQLAMYLFSRVLYGSWKRATQQIWWLLAAKNLIVMCVFVLTKHETETPLGFDESSGIYVLHVLRDLIYVGPR